MATYFFETLTAAQTLAWSGVGEDRIGYRSRGGYQMPRQPLKASKFKLKRSIKL